MFDDQTPNQAGQIPGNLPVSDKEPEDIFAGTEPAPPAAPEPAEETPREEVPPASPTALSAGVLKARQPDESAKAPTPQQAPVAPAALLAGSPPSETAPAKEQTAVDYQIKTPSIGKGIFTIVVVVVVLAIVGGGGWYIYTNFISSPSEESVFLETEEPETTIPAELEETPTIITPEGNGEDLADEMIDEEILFGEPIDRDGDGLDDDREMNLGTDPDNWDTDGDELSDGDEVLAWETDPLNPDTDGDTYLDGLEIKNGYSPLGPGRLFEAPANETEVETGETGVPATNTEEL